MCIQKWSCIFFPISETPDFHFFKILLLCAKVFWSFENVPQGFQGPKWKWMNSFFLSQVYSLLSYIPFLLFFSLLLKTINFPFSNLNSHGLPYIARKPIVYKCLYSLPCHNHFKHAFNFVNNLVRIVSIIVNVYCCCRRAKKLSSVQ